MHASRILAVVVLTTGSLLALGPSSMAAGPCADATIQGTAKDDTLRGTDGPDVIAGGGGDDLLVGLGGDDVLCGGAGQDRLRGGPGDDTLDGGGDAKVAEDTDYYLYYGDTLEGGPGSDTLVPGADSRHEGSVDKVTVAHLHDGVTADLAAGTVVSKNEEEPESDTIVGVVGTFTGTPYSDTVHGSEQPETLYGGAGGDYLDGRRGDDWVDGGPDSYMEHPDRAGNTVIGGPGDDNVNGGAGNDLLRGGSGNDFLQAGAGADRSYAGSGNDGINDDVRPVRGQVLAGGPGRDNLADLAFRDERGRYQAQAVGRIDMAEGRLRAHYGDITVSLVLNSFEEVASPAGRLWTIFGTEGRDDISAGFFEDPVRIYARGGNDRVFGSDQDDIINGGSGRDTGNGWGGRDRVVSVERIFTG